MWAIGRGSETAAWEISSCCSYCRGSETAVWEISSCCSYCMNNSSLSAACVHTANTAPLYVRQYFLFQLLIGKRFGDGVEDWQLLHPSVPAVLKSWHNRGYKVAIISNQLGVGRGKVDKRMVRIDVADKMLLPNTFYFYGNFVPGIIYLV